MSTETKKTESTHECSAIRRCGCRRDLPEPSICANGPTGTCSPLLKCGCEFFYKVYRFSNGAYIGSYDKDWVPLPPAGATLLP